MPTNYVSARRFSGDSRKMFQLNIGEDQKKSYDHFEHGAPGTAPFDKFTLVIAVLS